MELRAMLVPIGRHPHPAGMQVIDEAALRRIASAAKRRGQDIPVDFDHATAADAVAAIAGRIAPSTLAAMPDGLYGVIALNARGADALRAGAYRHLSPALLYNPRLSRDGGLHVERLVAVALTNHPNITTMQSLTPNPNLQEEFLMQELFDKLKAALGLPPGGGDAAALRAALEKLEGLSGPDGGAEEEAAEQGPGEAPESAADAPAMDELAALKAEVARLRAQKLDGEIEAAVADGKILPAQRDWAAAYAGQDPEGFRRFLANSRPAVQMGAIVARAAAAAVAPLSAEQETVNRMLGIDRALFDKYNI